MKLPNGYGSVYKLSGNRRKPFAARVTTGWTIDGKQEYKYIGYFSKRSEALTALAEYNQNPFDIDRKNITFAETYELWKEQTFPDLKKSSINNYKGGFKHCAAIHNKKMRELKTVHLQAIINNSNLALETLKHDKNLMNQVFKFAIENDIVFKNYASFVKIKKEKSESIRKVFTPEEVEALWQSDNPYAEVPLVLLYSGLRINELLTIEKKNVFLEERYMTGGLKSKAGKNRIIPIHNKIMPIIRRRFENCENYLFETKKKKILQYNYFNQNYWKQLMDELNLEHTTHDCRATFASKIDNTAANKTAVKRILGHSNSDITEHYIHKNIDDLLEAINLIE